MSTTPPWSVFKLHPNTPIKSRFLSVKQLKRRGFGQNIERLWRTKESTWYKCAQFFSHSWARRQVDYSSQVGSLPPSCHGLVPLILIHHMLTDTLELFTWFILMYAFLLTKIFTIMITIFYNMIRNTRQNKIYVKYPLFIEKIKSDITCDTLWPVPLLYRS